MIGIGFYIVGIVKIVTFVVVFITKIWQVEGQNEETKRTLQVVGGWTLLSLLTFLLMQYFYWININKVNTRQLQRQISWVATFLIFIWIPFTIIRRSQKMTDYGKEYLKGKVQDTFPCLNFTDDIIESESQDGIACPEDICINPYADDVLIHGASTLNSNRSEVITISQGLSYDTTLTPIN